MTAMQMAFVRSGVSIRVVRRVENAPVKRWPRVKNGVKAVKVDCATGFAVAFVN